MARIKYFNQKTGQWEYADSAYSPDSGQNVTLTTAQINALDGMFKVCAFIKADVSAEYNAFKTAFGIGGEVEPDVPDVPDVPEEPDEPEKTLTSISAVYSGGSVTAGTAVSDLTDIVVTAHYSDGTSETVTGYTLSGTISEGSNTVTVTYQGKTATFTVTGAAESGGEETTTPFGVEWTEGYLVSVSKSTLGENTAFSDWVASDYIDVTGKSEIRIHNDTGKLFVFQGCYYDESKTAKYEEAWYFNKQYVQGSTAYPSPLVLPIPEGAAYCRLSTSIQYGSASTGYVRYDELTYELV